MFFQVTIFYNLISNQKYAKNLAQKVFRCVFGPNSYFEAIQNSTTRLYSFPSTLLALYK
jgi:hypothetical protein